MNLAHWKLEDVDSLRQFYSAEPHSWTWAEMEAGSTPSARAAVTWLENSPTPRHNPLLLPRHYNEKTIWYILPFGEAQKEETRNEIWAFLGSVNTSFDGRLAQPSSQDEAERILSLWPGISGTFRLDVASSRDAKEWVRKALQRWQYSRLNRPRRNPSRWRSTEAMLREFSIALVTQDADASSRWLEELKASGRLSSENQVFLEIEFLSAFERWAEVWNHPQWSHLARMRRPFGITVRMIQAVWNVVLSKYSQSADSTDAVKDFQALVQERSSGLFRAHLTLHSKAVALTILVANLASKQPLPVLKGSLRELVPTSAPERSFLEALLTRLPELSPNVARKEPAGWIQVIDLLKDDRLQECWNVLREQAVPNVEWTRAALDCARLTVEKEVTQFALDLFDSLDENEQASVVSKAWYQRALDELRSEGKASRGADPATVEEWFKTILSDVDWNPIACIRENAAEWGDRARLLDPIDGKRIANLVLEADEQKLTIVRTALPYLATIFLADNEPKAAFQSIYSALLFAVVTSTDVGSGDFAMAALLLDALLETGPSLPIYNEAVQGCGELWRVRGTARRISWVLEILDILVGWPAPEEGSRRLFFEIVRTTLFRDSRRLEPEHWKMFRWACEDAGYHDLAESLPTASEEATDDDEFGGLKKKLSGRFVAIYSLLDAATTRAKSMIEDFCPDVKVRLSNDHGGSDYLKVLARDSDYFIVVTRCAKHAATDFIKAERPPSKAELIYPSGKGASSIFNSLLDKLRSN